MNENDFYGDDEEYEGVAVKSESFGVFLWRLFVLLFLGIITVVLISINGHLENDDPPRTEVYVACNGTNCSFSESLEELDG